MIWSIEVFRDVRFEVTKISPVFPVFPVFRFFRYFRFSGLVPDSKPLESERVPSDQLFRFFSGLGGHDPDEGPDDQRHEPDDLEQVRKG